jgi:hypothetical protein
MMNSDLMLSSGGKNGSNNHQHNHGGHGMGY